MAINETAAPRERLHALDNLRALAMWLGIVLHVSAIYMVSESPLPWRDGQRTLVADLAVVFIHAFRMPVFFILAGYFAAMLIQQRGAEGMLKHRLLRIGAPFAIFWPPIFAACVTLAMLFLHRMARGTWGLDEAVLPKSVPRGASTMHMWFLWMLLWLCVATAALHRYGGARMATLGRAVAAATARVSCAWWGFAVLALPLAALGSLYPKGVLMVSSSFLPPPAEWAHHGLLFAFGLCCYVHRDALLAVFTRRAWKYAGAGWVFFLGYLVLAEANARAPGAIPAIRSWLALAYTCATWLWCPALIGLFLRYLPRPNATLGYLADSSYWVYLVHMPVTIGLGALLYGLDWPALAKMGLNIAATTVLCLASYRLFVRHTAISQLLNGRRHPCAPRAGLAVAST